MYHLRRSGLHLDTACSKDFGTQRPTTFRRPTFGPGYRVYYARAGKMLYLLLCGGDKRKQSPDIERALEYLKDYKERAGTS